MKRLCPICKAPADSTTNRDFPFCSERCRLQDLGNWASEKYVVSEPVFDLSESGGEAGERKDVEGDEDFKGFRKPDGTIH